MRFSISSIFSFLFILGISQIAITQQSKTIELDISATKAVKLGTTAPLRDLIKRAPTSSIKKQLAKKNKVTPNFQNAIDNRVTNPNAKPYDIDATVQNGQQKIQVDPIEPDFILEGMDQNTANGISPPDVCGDVGKNHYIQMINGSFFHIYDKEGNALAEPISTNTIWNPIGFSSLSDPVIIYDQEADRWIITEIVLGNQLLFAITTTDDPFGSWNAYSFATPNLPDYPKYSLWPDSYGVTTNEESSGVLHAYFIDREDILAGLDNVDVQRIEFPGATNGPGILAASPIDWSGNTPPPIDRNPMIIKLNDDAWGDAAEDQYDLYSVNLDFDDPNNTIITTTEIETSPYDTDACSEGAGQNAPCVPQPGGENMDGIPSIIMHQVHYWNYVDYESIVFNFLANAGTDDEEIAGIRWTELRRTDETEWTVYQEGNFATADGSEHRLIPAIAQDKNNNIALGYSITGAEIFPSLRFTGRRYSDPINTMTITEYEMGTGLSSNLQLRYGDYAQMVVDPVDEKTFWFTGEYFKEDNLWGSKIVKFTITRDTIDIGPHKLVRPIASSDLTDMERVEIEFKNFGLGTQSSFQVGFIYEDGTGELADVNFDLAPDSTYTHIFTQTIDPSALGDHTVTAYSILDGDTGVVNDSIDFIITQLAKNDIILEEVQGLDETACGDTLPISLIILNNGTELLASAEIDIIVNGNPIPSIPWAGSLAYGETTLVDLSLSDFITEGNNEITISVNKPNNTIDQRLGNETIIQNTTVILSDYKIILDITTDLYPEETTWELFYTSGELVASGGPYQESDTLYSEEICTFSDSCFIFIINDSAGDGICCNYGLGLYTLRNIEGQVLATGGEYAFSETVEFCADLECMLVVDVLENPISGTGADDGAIFVQVSGGVEPYLFSFDGGISFGTPNFRNNLTPGEYTIVVKDDNNCGYIETVNITVCTMEVTVDVLDASTMKAQDGSISISVINGTPPYIYIIDNGTPITQSDPVFQNLLPDEYNITVIDANLCNYVNQVSLGFPTATSEVDQNAAILVKPNPSDGVFQLEVHGIVDYKNQIEVKIYDARGQFLYARIINKYDNIYKGEFSLFNYTNGTYYLKIEHEKVKRLVKVIKSR